MPSQFTIYDLEHVTDFFGFEGFCHDLMALEGYTSIQPMGGYHDRGRDAIHCFASPSTSTVFAYSTRKDWETKLRSDIRKVSGWGHPCNKFVFVTNQVVSAGDFDNLKADIERQYRWDFDLYDLHRIATLVDNSHPTLKGRHTNIFRVSSRIPEERSLSDFDPQIHAAFFLGSHDHWIEQHTPLLAEHKEIPTFVNMQGADNHLTRLRVSSIPETAPIAILLGESGAGKTSSLWKIVVETCQKLLAGEPTLAPILVSLRGWRPDRMCRALLDEQFSPFDLPGSVIEHELSHGRFLVLFDSLNEVSLSSRNECRYDIASFISRYPENHYVISCRSAEYHPDLIPLSELSVRLGRPLVYEICRLERDQIIQYAENYFESRDEDPRPFLEHLRVESGLAWSDRTSQVHLARIPLFLQLFLDVFQKTGALPNSRANLLSALVNRIVERENARMQVQIDRMANDRVLGHLSFRAAIHGHELQFPERYAHTELALVIGLLKDAGLLPHSVTVGEIWRTIVSANFLQYVDQDSVAWLHQLIRDYFLGVEAARIWESGDSEAQSDLLRRMEPSASDIACTMTLGLLGSQEGSTFLWSLIERSELNARRAFEGQSEEHRGRVIHQLVASVLRKNDYDTKSFNTIARVLPYVEVAEGFDSHFYSSDSVDMAALLIAALSQLIIEHAPTVSANAAALPYFDSAVLEARFQTTKTAVRRSEELLRKYLRHSNELVSFHAAKGLFEHDKPAAVAQLRKLLQSRNRQVVSLVEDLVEEWGIQ